MDGYELTLTIRKEEKDKGKKRTPIIAITASALKEEVKVCRAAGMDDYLSKPLAKRDLGLMLKKWLGKEGDTLH
jgi:CheY-like chemotaxis protein